MVIHDHAIVHVQNRLHEKEPLLSRNIPVLDVGLPQLVHACHHPIGSGSTGIARSGALSLWAQNPHLPAQPIHFLLVDDELVFAPEPVSQLAIAIAVAVAFDSRLQQCLDALIRHLLTGRCLADARGRSPAVAAYPRAVRVLPPPVVGGPRHLNDAQHESYRDAPAHPLASDCQSSV